MGSEAEKAGNSRRKTLRMAFGIIIGVFLTLISFAIIIQIRIMWDDTKDDLQRAARNEARMEARMEVGRIIQEKKEREKQAEYSYTKTP